MFTKSITLLTSLIFTLSVQAKNVSLADAKKVLNKQQYMQYAHETWQKDRKKAKVTDYSHLLNTKQGGNTLTVGPNVQCDFPTIQLAINFAIPGDTIFVGSGIVGGTDAKLNIDKELTLVGGLDSTCQVFTANRTFLQLDEIGAVITIDVSGGKNVTISGFDISGSQAGNQFLLTSGIHATGDGTVTVRNSRIHKNEAFFGGGISAVNGVTLNISENTEIYSNTATGQGGGIYCNQSTLNIIDTKIGRFDNGEDQGNVTSTENSFGGGIAAIDCPTRLGDTPIGIGPVEINYNKSDGGTGIYSLNSPVDYSTVGSRMSFNRSNGFTGNAIPGTIWAENSIEINLNDISFTDNNSGKVLTMEGNTDLNLNSTCSNPPCLKFLRNGFGIFTARDNVNIVANKILIDNNSHFTLISNQGAGNITINNSVISNNKSRGSSGIIASTGTGEINLNHVTIVSNYKETGVDLLFSINDSSTISFNAGIIWGNNSINLSSELFPLNISNSIMQYNPAGYINTIQTDPLLANEAAGDYHISINSPAINYVNGVSLIDDIDGDNRADGVDTDAGADEWTDLIFKNDFEQQ